MVIQQEEDMKKISRMSLTVPAGKQIIYGILILAVKRGKNRWSRNRIRIRS
jgi:hypothetical protein